MFKKKSFLQSAFTLAEVLITLVIIGVVAALVMQPLLLSAMDLQYASALRKEVSVLTNSYTRYVADTGGDPVELFTNGSQHAYNELIPYLNVYRSCPGGGTCANYDIKNRVPLQTSSGGSFATTNNYGGYPSAILADGTTVVISSHTSSKDCIVSGTSNLVTNSEGEVIPSSDPDYSYTWTNNVCGDFIVDTNGRKPPNRFGLDVFEFSLDIKGRVANNQWTQVYGDTLYTLKNGKIIRPKDTFTDGQY